MFYRDKFRDERKKKKLSQELLGKMLGKNRMAINKWENGKCIPYESDIRMAAQCLQINVNEISDLADIDYKNFSKNSSLGSSVVGSFVEKIESSLSIQDRILLDGINVELHTLRDKIHIIEQQESPSSEIIADEINAFIYKKDIKGRFTYINKSYLRYLDTENNMILGRSNGEIFGWQETEIFDEIETKAMRGIPTHNVKIVIPGSMKKKHGLLSAFPMYGVNGTLKEVIFKIDDVTGNIELFDKYKTLEKVIHSSNEILWIKKGDGTYSFIGAPIYSISGYHVNEFLNKSLFWLANVVDKYDRDKVGIFYKTYESGESINYKIRTKDNTIKFVKERVFRQDKLTFGIIQDVTSELKAQEDKQLLLDVINEIPEAMWVIDDYGKNVRILSSSIAKLTGASQKVIKTHPEIFPNHIHEGDREKYKSWAAGIKSNTWWKDETKKSMCEKLKFRIILKNGQSRWFEETVYSTVKFKRQGIMFGVFKDITKEHELQQEMQYLFKCVNDMDSMFWIAKLTKNERLNYITISDSVKKLYGMTKTQFAKKYIALKDMFHWDDKEVAYKPTKDTLFSHNYEYNITVNEKTKWLQEHVYKKENLFFGLISDITENKIKDKRVNLLANTMNNIDACILVTTNIKPDRDELKDKYEVLFVSDGFEKIFSASKQIMFDDSHYLKNFIHPEDFERVNKWWKNVCDLGIQKETSLDYRIITPKAQTKWVNDCVNPIGDIDGKPVRFGIITDITALKTSRKL